LKNLKDQGVNIDEEDGWGMTSFHIGNKKVD
jgi:hypothetical protein